MMQAVSAFFFGWLTAGLLFGLILGRRIKRIEAANRAREERYGFTSTTGRNLDTFKPDPFRGIQG